MIEKFFSEEIYLKQTELCLLMNEEGSDKGSGHHNFTTFYNYLFSGEKSNINFLFELGLGTNDLNIPSNMSGSGTPCGSLRAWKRYFHNAHIFGGDIDSKILIQEDRIRTFFCDQLNKNSINKLKENFNFFFDIVIEDGLHTFEANVNFFENFIDKVRKGGYFIIEDIDQKYFSDFKDYIKYNKYNFEFMDLVIIPNELNKSDNNLLLVKK